MVRQLTWAFAVVSLLASCGEGAGGGGTGGGGGASAGGGSARVEGYLRADVFRSLVVEVDAVPGFEPRVSSVDGIATTLSSLLDKPDGVDVVVDGAITSLGAGHAYTDAEILDIGDAVFDLAVTATTTKIHVLFLDGHSARDTDQGTVLGIAFDNRIVAVFSESIDVACSSSTSIGDFFREELCATAEQTVWKHEIGHVLGLVNLGAPMVADHEDHAHARHDANQDCVMYWAAESPAIFDSLASRILSGSEQAIPPFDQACLDDLAAIRDR